MTTHSAGSNGSKHERHSSCRRHETYAALGSQGRTENVQCPAPVGCRIETVRRLDVTPGQTYSCEYLSLRGGDTFGPCLVLKERSTAAGVAEWGSSGQTHLTTMGTSLKCAHPHFTHTSSLTGFPKRQIAVLQQNEDNENRTRSSKRVVASFYFLVTFLRVKNYLHKSRKYYANQNPYSVFAFKPVKCTLHNQSLNTPRVVLTSTRQSTLILQQHRKENINGKFRPNNTARVRTIRRE